MKKNSIYIARLLAVSLLLFGSCVAANDENDETINVGSQPLGLVEIKADQPDQGAMIEIEQNKAKFFNLPEGTKGIAITEPTIADINVPNEGVLRIIGLKIGETDIKITTIDKEGKRHFINKRIVVSYNLTMIKKELSRRFATSDITIENLGTAIALSGTVDTPKTASDVMEFIGKIVGNERNIINNLSVAIPTQVMLKVKVAKLDRTVSKSLGINWKSFSLGSSFSILGVGGKSGGSVPATLSTASAIAGAIAGTGIKPSMSVINIDTNDTSLKATTTPNFFSDGTTVPGNGVRWTMNYSDRNANNIGAVIDALAEESLATVLAEPTLVALSGQNAKFQSGGEQPYRDASTSGTASSTSFKDWGIMLDFTPNVISDNRISITMKSEISAVDKASENGEPPLTKQNVSTVVELGSGQSLAIAGLLKKEVAKSATELPGLANIPILGGLFRSSSHNLTESELIIIITPYIVRPSSKKLVTPVERAPKMLAPCQTNFFRRFTADKSVTNEAGFTVS